MREAERETLLKGALRIHIIRMYVRRESSILKPCSRIPSSPREPQSFPENIYIKRAIVSTHSGESELLVTIHERIKKKGKKEESIAERMPTTAKKKKKEEVHPETHTRGLVTFCTIYLFLWELGITSTV